MGMFDEVRVNCPHCGVKNTLQSKAGRCILATYSGESVPTEIALDLNGDKVYCKSCKKETKVVSSVVKRTQVDLIKWDPHEYD